MPFVSEDPDCQWSNQTEKLAVECVQEKHGFYDACQKECKTEVFFLYLSQNLELEHIVYGKVSFLKGIWKSE